MKHKYSKKYLSKMKKRILGCTFSMAMSLMLIAGGMLAEFSMPLNTLKIFNKTKLSADEGNTLNKEDADQSKVTIADDGAIVCESIVQGVRECNLEDGNYVFRVTGNINGTDETKDYNVELINYYEDVIYSLDEGEETKTISLGDNTTDYKMLVVKYHKNLTIDEGVTLTATMVDNLTYKKGMYLCVIGELKNNGTISMSARGTYNQEGENVYLWKNIDDSYEYVPAVGGAGANRRNYTWREYKTRDEILNGIKGTNGINRATGGGGSGALKAVAGHSGNGVKGSGSGSSGTSYSGGTGGGGICTDIGGTHYAGNGAPNGGAGGDGFVHRCNSSCGSKSAGGGAGNLGGNGKITASGAAAGSNNEEYSGENGTGGLLIIYSDYITNNGTISSNGSKGGLLKGTEGGSSGGGSINIFANNINNSGTTTTIGGNTTGNGGNGGDGSTTITKTMPDLKCANKDLIIDINETYTIDKSKLLYINSNNSQTDFVAMGEIKYEILNESIATIDENGKITPNSRGNTKIKITDITNNLSTYVYLEVVKGVKADVQEGENFSIALKQNGTVWSYGINDKGQLGIGDNTENGTASVEQIEKSREQNSLSKAHPTQVKINETVTKIAVGYSHSLALTKDGEVYTWGSNSNGQLGLDDVGATCDRPTKIEGLTNIVKIDAYKNKSTALSSDGEVYVWGEGYDSLPTKVIFSEKVANISGDLMLTEEGKVYSFANIETPIEGLIDIEKISAGTNHNLALDAEGNVYAWGTNTYGECGIETTGTIAVRKVISNILRISAGNCTSILQSEDGRIYVLGNNANGQIGLSETSKVSKATQITLTENIEIENISAGEGTHSSLIDINGYVWNTGLNTNGELGTGDNTNKNTFTKIGDMDIAIKDKIYLDLDETLTIDTRLENGFNLKIDLIDDNLNNFEIQLQNNEIISIEGNTLVAKKYGMTILTITHTPTGKVKEIEVSVMPKMESIVQGFRDRDLSDGEYEIYVEGKIYKVELINYYDNVIYSLDEGETSKIVSLGDDSTDYKTLVVKYHGDLTIDEGVKLTANTVDNLTYKKGMYICVLGDIYNNGEISMTARGTYNQEGENIYLWKNIDNSYEYVPALGGIGGEQQSTTQGAELNGKPGTSGTGRQTGGGGTGGRKKLLLS